MEKQPSQNSSNFEKERANREIVRNQIFDQLVANHVLESFHDDMEEADISPKAYKEVVDAFGQLSEESKREVLAIPAQLRVVLFARYAKLLNEEKIDGSGVVLDILQKAKKYGFTLGFHVSPSAIRADKDGSWQVRGTEPDHRHNDLPMAYYSLDYAHRYLKKPARYLYVIRAELGNDSAHYRDNDRSWGHAPSLSIVDQIDMESLEQEMEQRFKEMEKKEKGDEP